MVVVIIFDQLDWPRKSAVDEDYRLARKERYWNRSRRRVDKVAALNQFK